MAVTTRQSLYSSEHQAMPSKNVAFSDDINKMELEDLQELAKDPTLSPGEKNMVLSEISERKSTAKEKLEYPEEGLIREDLLRQYKNGTISDEDRDRLAEKLGVDPKVLAKPAENNTPSQDNDDPRAVLPQPNNPPPKADNEI